VEAADDTAVRAGLLRPLQIDIHGRTDRGLKRTNNEDRFLVTPVGQGLQTGQLLAVADGMGGHAGGEFASAAAVDTLSDLALRIDSPNEIVARLRPAIEELDTNLVACGQKQTDLFGMGTTLTVAMLIGNRLHLAHAGDSRAYLYRDGRLQRLTHDHALIEQLVEQGLLTPEEAARHPMRHVVTNAVGGNAPGVQVDQSQLDVRPGDVVLLCSDGLTEMLTEANIAAVLAEEVTPAGATESLILLANSQGGRDNITVVVARLD
jgi:protein phosphatase